MNANAKKLYQKIMGDKAIQAELARAGSKAEGLEAVIRTGGTPGAARHPGRGTRLPGQGSRARK